MTGIAEYAFYGCTNLSQVTIPNSVTSIEESVFEGCTALSQITIPNSVTSIGFRAFAGSGLSQVTIPENVTGIAEYAFYGCTMLSHVTLGNNVTSIGESVFEGCTELSQITIPNSITNIGGSAFTSCTNLSQVTWNAVNCKDFTSSDNRLFADCPVTDFTFGEQVEHIPAYLCYDMSKLTQAIIPENVKTIGNNAFSGCANLSQATLGNNVMNIGMSVFENCTALSQITIPNSTTGIGDSAFAGCTNLSQVTLGNNVMNIGMSVFENCTALSQITIPNSITNIGGSAFTGCTNLSQVTWNATNCEDFTNSDNRPFANCPVNKVAFGNLVEHIPAYLCYGMTQLLSLSLPNSVKTIGTGAFCQSGFMSLVIPAGITESGTDAFKDCNKLNNIIFDGNVAEWCGIDFKNNAANPIFSASENVKLYINYQPVSTLVIPEGVTEIRNHAFNKAAFLTSIDIPESVTAIGESAFAGCSALNSIYCRAIVPPTIEATTFSETDHTIPLHILKESFAQYLTTDLWNEFTNLKADLTPQQPLTVTYYVEGSDAYFLSHIESGESFQCYTFATEGKAIITITLNGKDITDQLGENGLLTIENVTEDCTIIISTDDKTSATETIQDTAKFRAWQSKGEIFVEHTDDMVYVTVYDLNGRIIKQEKTTGYGVLRIPVTDNLLHIVQANYSDGTSATKKVQ